MPYLVKVEGRFAAAHAVRGYDGSCERLHGHNFAVTAVAEALGAKLRRVTVEESPKYAASYVPEI
jgi:6-pyruvoyltetrahydropterin/6-carboxytetrahydropterin synthase